MSRVSRLMSCVPWSVVKLLGARLRTLASFAATSFTFGRRPCFAKSVALGTSGRVRRRVSPPNSARSRRHTASSSPTWLFLSGFALTSRYRETRQIPLSNSNSRLQLTTEKPAELRQRCHARRGSGPQPGGLRRVWEREQNAPEKAKLSEGRCRRHGEADRKGPRCPEPRRRLESTHTHRQTKI